MIFGKARETKAEFGIEVRVGIMIGVIRRKSKKKPGKKTAYRNIRAHRLMHREVQMKICTIRLHARVRFWSLEMLPLSKKLTFWSAFENLKNLREIKQLTAIFSMQ